MLARRDMTGVGLRFRIKLWSCFARCIIDFLVEHLARQKVVRDGRIVRLAGGAGTGGVVGAPTVWGGNLPSPSKERLRRALPPVGGSPRR